ncbi:MAG: hypothetical protein A2271_03730 [Candidatus Moranbacteria bacterium RIFOXYA12_FULL_35_19]|nr:MAG: Transcriptional regulator, TrmB [Candidatus Moranbacteria bacterium GW2011_GWF2_35_39]OGI31841.1 MAG: hypothetical protein A2343_01335 [Candidatus Moranbacteria bacterium RIFOXYB12_FULL_35_8]OGI33364.1 MAG: hypothetical protein A2489_03885 [Candidatus Moranbacteria bacterium RIFOXYC12_FULL_36_13]OGI36286.1 MAG: hypothetical protein A2271_03730 [Candidatus Moranbacteria bacterium RIFOXYA12_FULL_35_19]
MENLDKNFEYLGILGKEKDIYLALLKLKKATVAQIARLAEVKRTTVYHCLDSLLGKNLVVQIILDNKKFYVAEDPEISLNNLLEERKKIIQYSIPELKNIFGAGIYQPEIKIYRNISGMKKLFEDALTNKEKKERYYLSDFNLEELMGKEFVDDFVERRIKTGIKSQALRSFKYKPEREAGIIHAKELREVRFVPEEIIIKPYVCIYDDKVAMISTKEEKLGFIIQSHEFAEAQKAIFDMIWNSVAI